MAATEASAHAAPAQVCGLPGSPEQLEELKSQIMADIEAKLSQKEESLWRRGQVEIRRLQLEQAQVAASVGTLQERQEAIVKENQKIRGALLEVTSKFETVVKEMREVLRALPQRPGPSSGGAAGDGLSPTPSMASTSPSEVARQEEQPSAVEHHAEPQTPGLSTPLSGQAALGELWSSCEKSRRRPEAQTPVPMWHPQRGCDSGLSGLDSYPWDSQDGLGDGDSKTFCTPPRAGASPTGKSCVEDLIGAPPLPASWRGLTPTASPAVLSLASALPSGSTGGASSHLAQQPSPAMLNNSTLSCSTAASVSSVHPSPSMGLKRLQLAECLKTKADAAGPSGSGGAAPALATPQQTSKAGGGSSGRGQLSTGVTGVSATSMLSSPTRLKNFDFISVELKKEPVQQGKEPVYETLGIEVNEEGTSLRVESVDEAGLVGRHNLRQECDRSRILPGDRIIEANHVQNDPTAMLYECKVRQWLNFTLIRDLGGATPADDVQDARAKADAKEALPRRPGIIDEDAASGGVSAPAGASVAAGTNSGGSPQPTKLRPEATVFVPSSSQKENVGSLRPPGLGKLDAVAQAAAAAEVQGQGEAVCRALFR